MPRIVNLNIFTVTLFLVCQTAQCIVLIIQYSMQILLFFCQQGIKGCQNTPQRRDTTNCLKLISSNQKYLIVQNIFQLSSYAFLKAILYECQRLCKFEYLYISFVFSMSGNTVYCIDCAIFICGETILLSTRDKRVAITLHKIKILNLGNQYHKDATQVAPGIIEKF